MHILLGAQVFFLKKMSQVCDLEFDSDLSTARLDKMKLPKFFKGIIRSTGGLVDLVGSVCSPQWPGTKQKLKT